MKPTHRQQIKQGQNSLIQTPVLIITNHELHDKAPAELKQLIQTLKNYNDDKLNFETMKTFAETYNSKLNANVLFYKGYTIILANPQYTEDIENQFEELEKLNLESVPKLIAAIKQTQTNILVFKIASQSLPKRFEEIIQDEITDQSSTWRAFQQQVKQLTTHNWYHPAMDDSRQLVVNPETRRILFDDPMQFTNKS